MLKSLINFTLVVITSVSFNLNAQDGHITDVSWTWYSWYT